MRHSGHARPDVQHLALGLGSLSIALGIAGLVAPGRMAELVGVRHNGDTRNSLRSFGARELTSGLAILSQPDRARWLWSRVGGDAVDLGWLGNRARVDDVNRHRLALASAVVAGVTALDVLAARRTRQLVRTRQMKNRAVRVEEVVTVNRTIDDVFAFWRDFENFPRFMRHVERIDILDARRSRWRAKGPAGISVQWDAELVASRPNEWIS